MGGGDGFFMIISGAGGLLKGSGDGWFEGTLGTGFSLS